ncbi:MAG: FCD domain-containing protein [Alcanivorax sp.]|nr:FCD domain-containing protein [Alcanivorax sp.]
MGSSPQPKTRTDRAYLLLRADVISGRLKPGTKLRVEQLRADYDIGATPLREALSRLSADGFVISEGQRGFRVVPMSYNDLQDITRVRILIETEALRDSIESGDDVWESRLVAAYYRLSKLEAQAEPDYEQRERANEVFHSALLAGCGSPLLLRLHHTLYDQHKRYRNISLLTATVPRDVHEEHRAIYDAALARDATKACDATRVHIMRTMEVTLEVFRKAEEKPASATN